MSERANTTHIAVDCPALIWQSHPLKLDGSDTLMHLLSIMLPLQFSGKAKTNPVNGLQTKLIEEVYDLPEQLNGVNFTRAPLTSHLTEYAQYIIL